MKRQHFFSIGSFKCTLFKDSEYQYRIPDYFENITEDEALRALEKHNTSNGLIPSPYVALLVETDNKKILIDTGLGKRSEALKFKGQEFRFNGQLIAHLDTKGLLEKIDGVVLTHLHPDHAGGLFTEEKKCLFPNSEFFVHVKEWDYWTNKYKIGTSPVFDYVVLEQLAPLQKERLRLIDEPQFEIIPGINTILAPGHTPGHLVVHLNNEGEDLLYISDSWLHPLHIAHLNWKNVFDLDQDLARKTRIQLLKMANAKSMLVQSFHFDFPGLGTIKKSSDNWHWFNDG